MNGSVMDQVVKTVNVIDTVNTYEYKGETETFVAPINGKYKIELWGASGGGTTIMSGKGGYTVSEYNLEAGDTLYGISKKYGISVDTIKNNNNLNN